MKRILQLIRKGDGVSLAGYQVYTDAPCKKMSLRHPRSLMSPDFTVSLAGLRKALAWMDQQNYSDEPRV